MVTSASTTTSRAKSFIRKKLTALHRGDVNALVASSIAIASSIGSPSLHTNHLSSSGGQKAHTSHPDRQTIGQKPGSHPAVESAWKTAYSTARMVVDVTKESSDMFLPLKTVVGALSFLIKNYDVSPYQQLPICCANRLCSSKPRAMRGKSKSWNRGCCHSRIYSVLL